MLANPLLPQPFPKPGASGSRRGTGMHRCRSEGISRSASQHKVSIGGATPGNRPTPGGHAACRGPDLHSARSRDPMPAVAPQRNLPRRCKHPPELPSWVPSSLSHFQCPATSGTEGALPGVLGRSDTPARRRRPAHQRRAPCLRRKGLPPPHPTAGCSPPCSNPSPATRSRYGATAAGPSWRPTDGARQRDRRDRVRGNSVSREPEYIARASTRVKQRRSGGHRQMMLPQAASGEVWA